jgi:hypothetical protein
MRQLLADEHTDGERGREQQWETGLEFGTLFVVCHGIVLLTRWQEFEKMD